MTKRILPSVAELPVRVGIRLIALARLDEGLVARERLVAGRDGEALHDFRVALRRLRSGLRAYRPWFDDTVGSEDRHRIRDIARGTGQARDIEVLLEWLEHATLPSEVVPGATLLEARLRSAGRDAERTALRAVHRFPYAADKLRTSLRRYHGEIDPGAPLGVKSCAVVSAGLLTGLGDELGSHFDLMRTDDDPRSAHRARIEAKRLRYLLEPFREDVSSGEATLLLLRRLQDGLGDLHDLDVMLAESATMRGELEAGAQAADRTALDAFIEHVRGLRSSALAEVRADWLAGGAAELVEQVAAFARELGAIGGDASFEIERKYLLNGLPRRRKNRTVVRIDQGWLPGTRVQERIRRVRGEQGTRWLRTVKLGRGLVRREIEEEIDEELFRRLWPLTRGRRLSKRRYSYQDNGRTWVVDRFLGFDLVLAEIELDSADEQVVPPGWLQGYIETEVTGQADYLNVNLTGRADRDPEASPP